MNFSLDWLEALEAVVRTGSFSAAAEELHKAQSAVSYAIGRLESQLDLELFDRSGHRAELTPAGARVLEAAHRILAEARGLETLGARLTEGWEPRLEVVLDGILPMDDILRAFARLTDENVPTQVQVKVEFLGGVQFRFEKDEADIMLVKDYLPRGDYEVMELAPIEVVLVVGAGHPLAALEGPIALETLHEHVELTVHDSSESSELTDETRFGGSRVFHLSDFHTKLRALRLGLGFGWMPTYQVEEELQTGVLVEVPWERRSRYSFAPLLVHRRDRPPGRTARRLIELLLEGV